MDPVVHFEMPLRRRRRASPRSTARPSAGTPRRSAPTWASTSSRPTAASDARGSTTPGAINGGFFQRKPDWPAQYPSVVISVGNADAAMAKVKSARRHHPRRADGDPGRRQVRVVHGLRGQPRRPARAGAAPAVERLGRGARRARRERCSACRAQSACGQPIAGQRVDEVRARGTSRSDAACRGCASAPGSFFASSAAQRVHRPAHAPRLRVAEAPAPAFDELHGELTARSASALTALRA